MLDDQLINTASFLKAAGSGDLTTVKAYIENGGNPNSTNDYNATALIYAASHGQADIIRYLLSIGADSTIRNIRGNTPYDIARNNGDHELLRLFQDYDPSLFETGGKSMLRSSKAAKNKSRDQQMLEQIRSQAAGKIEDLSERMKRNEFGGGDMYANAVLSGWAHAQREQLYSIYDMPFFGKIRFHSLPEKAETYYIGKHDFDDLVISANNKVASIFYLKKTGELLHETLGTVQVKLIRQFEIYDGVIVHVHDLTEDAVQYVDPILQKRLQEQSNSSLKNVIETIQEEQYRIISADAATPLIVQGSAGSGKTTIALHRISYLVYNN